MYPVRKLAELQPGQRRRKILLLLAEFERRLVASAGPDTERMSDADFLTLCRFAASDPKISAAGKTGIETLSARFAAVSSAAAGSAETETAGKQALRLRLCNAVRNTLLQAAGTFPAEWDLIHPERTAQGSAAYTPQTVSRFFYPGVCVFLEDIRSPFNVGSVFRTAEAFGAERLYVSPGCAPPEHPRARRSAMGCTEYLPWESKTLEELPGNLPFFALETGGTPIADFRFPRQGIAVIGSEELGVSPEALDKAEARVSIPMAGIKASLNVGVAFGILMEAWTRSLRQEAPESAANSASSAAHRL